MHSTERHDFHLNSTTAPLVLDLPLLDPQRDTRNERPLASMISMVLQAGCRKEQLKIAELQVAFEGEREKEMRIEGIQYNLQPSSGY